MRRFHQGATDVYAVIEDSGQQFRVSEGDVLNVDLRDLPAEGKEITFERVLLVSDNGNVRVGAPLVEGAKVLAEIVDPEARGPKVFTVHFRRRKASHQKTGHRQTYLQVRITKIVA
jgi:large subunit ribosomal protein L21